MRNHPVFAQCCTGNSKTDIDCLCHLKVLPERGVLADLLLVLCGEHLQLLTERLQLPAHLRELVLLGTDSVGSHRLQFGCFILVQGPKPTRLANSKVHRMSDLSCSIHSKQQQN